MVTELINSYGLEVVQAYMDHIQKNAELAVRDMLKTIANTCSLDNRLETLQSIDYLDDGSTIKLSVQINMEDGDAVFDFRLFTILFNSLFFFFKFLFYILVVLVMKFGETVMRQKP